MRTFVVLAISLATGTLGMGYPKPSAVGTAWQLQFKFQPVKRITVTLPGEGARTYWYMIYTVRNETDREVVFYPEFTLVTNRLGVMRSGMGVAPEVYKAIKKEYHNTYPWLEHPRDLVGPLARGEDNARDSVAVWPDFDRKTSSFSVFVGGLSGEAVEVPNPLYVKGKSDPKKVPDKFVLRKTLQIKYALPTDPGKRDRVEPGLGDRPALQWIMR